LKHLLSKEKANQFLIRSLFGSFDQDSRKFRDDRQKREWMSEKKKKEEEVQKLQKEIEAEAELEAEVEPEVGDDDDN
jgi:hypothetical protein